MTEVFQITDVSQLDLLAERFLEKYPKPRAFALLGEMGAGKTTFVRALCRQLGIDATSSPTFGIVHEYENKPKVKVLHFDLYRMKNFQEVLDIGLEDYLSQDAYIFIEWPQIILPYYKEELIPIQVEVTTQGRSFQF